jgi:hypothetical protein
MKTGKLAIRSLAAVIFVAAIGAALFYWLEGPAKAIANLEGASREDVWSAFLCRAPLYTQKAKGDLPDLSWAELWGLTRPGRGFDCTEGSSLESSVQYSATASEADRKAGARIFHERCSACHGVNGSGGPFAPSLTRPDYDHGDSDLAIYKVLRDGVPGTGMQARI